MDSEIHLGDLCKGELTLEIQGAFTHDKVDPWAFKLTESRVLQNPVSVFSAGRSHLEAGQSSLFSVDTSVISGGDLPVGERCPVLTVRDAGKRVISSQVFCLE